MTSRTNHSTEIRLRCGRCAVAAVLAAVWVSLGATAHSADSDNGAPSLSLNFEGANLDDVLEYLSRQAGFIVVRDVDIDAKVNIISHQPLSKDQAIDLLNTVLSDKGYAAIRNDRVLRIVYREDAKMFDLPVQSGADPEALEKKDEMVHQIIPVSFVNAEELLEDLEPLLDDYATITSNESSNAIIITDTQTNVRRMMKIIAALDTSISDISQVEVFPLKYADADDTADMISEIFEEDQSSSSKRSSRGGGSSFMERMISMRSRGADPRTAIGLAARGGGDRGRGGGVSGDTGEARQSASRVVAVADERTNAVVVRAPEELLDTIADVLAELDSDPAQDQTIFVFPLANADAENLSTILMELFEQATESSGGGTSNTRGGFFSSRFGGGTTGGRTTGGRSSSGGGSSGTGIDEDIYVVADTDTNSLLILTNPENYEKVIEIVKQLDEPLPQALIKVLIAEVTHDDGSDIGAEFSAFRESGDTLYDGVTSFGLGAETSGLIVEILDDEIDVTLRAIADAGKLEVLSRPSIIAVNYQEANITVGNEVPRVTNSRVTSDGQVINTVDYEDVGIILDVTPHINTDGVVTLDVSTEISTLTGEIVQTSDTVAQPIIAKRTASSRVVVPDRKTIIIGGLMEDQHTETITKVPFLGDIWLIGRLFQRRIESTAKTELMIFLTPNVVQEYEGIASLTESEKSKADLTPKSFDGEKFDEHLLEMEI